MASLIASQSSAALDRPAWVELGRIDLIPRGQGRCFSVGRFRVAVFRARDGTVGALENACPHQGGPLADGVLGAGMVVCPLHAHRFRVADGSGVDTTLSARTFVAELRDGVIFLAIPADA
jgi:nitrite reductase (NADH) small subunit